MAKGISMGSDVAALAVVPNYDAAQALSDAAAQIDDIEDLELSWAQVIEKIIEAAQARLVTSVTIKQTSGAIPTQHPNWVEIRQRLMQDRGFNVANNPQTGFHRVSWD